MVQISRGLLRSFIDGSPAKMADVVAAGARGRIDI
jgi:hypothetical protein